MRTQTRTPETETATQNKATEAPDLYDTIRSYVRAHQRLHGQKHTAKTLGVSSHTLWRHLERGHAGRAVPAAGILQFTPDGYTTITRPCRSPAALPACRRESPPTSPIATHNSPTATAPTLTCYPLLIPLKVQLLQYNKCNKRDTSTITLRDGILPPILPING